MLNGVKSPWKTEVNKAKNWVVFGLDTMLRVPNTSSQVGILGLLVNAISEEAKRF